MATWWLWIVAALLCAALELFSGALVFLALAAGLLVTGLVVLFTTPPLWVALTVFSFSALVLVPLAVFRGRTRSPLQTAPRYGVAGERASQNGAYRLTLSDRLLTLHYKGDHFPVRDQDGAALDEGAHVRLLRFEGITAVVRRLTPEDPNDAL